MTAKSLPPLSRREREIMDILYARGEASAAEVRDALPDPPSYSAVRALLRILEEKGHARHHQDGRTYIYSPTTERRSIARKMLGQVMSTFFEGSPEKTLAALLDVAEEPLSQEELDRLAKMIDKAKREGR